MWRHLNSDSGFSTGKKPTRTRAPCAMPTCGVDAFAVTVWRHHAAARGLLPLRHALTFPRPYRRRRGAGRSTIHSRACRRGGWGAPSPRRPRPAAAAACTPKRRRVMPNLPLVVSCVEVPEASGPPVAPPACVRGSTAGRIPLPRCKAALLPMVRGGGRPRKGKAAQVLAGAGGLATDWRSSNDSSRRDSLRGHVRP